MKFRVARGDTLIPAAFGGMPGRGAAGPLGGVWNAPARGWSIGGQPGRGQPPAGGFLGGPGGSAGGGGRRWRVCGPGHGILGHFDAWWDLRVAADGAGLGSKW